MAKPENGNIITPYNNGVVREGGADLPDKGTGTGLNGDTYGASIAPDATNGRGGFNANSDPPFDLESTDDLQT
jgi:hypothetical protein